MFILVRLFDQPLTTPFSNFHQTKISDLVQISPHDFNKPSIEAIEDYINSKYANRVEHDNINQQNFSANLDR